MSQKIKSAIDRAFPQRLTFLIIILSFAIATVTMLAKFTGSYWHPDSERWGPVFTVYGYTINSITVVFLIVAAILLYAAMLWIMRYRLPGYFLFLSLSILFTMIFYFMRSNVKIGDGISFTMSSTVGILHYKEALGSYIMHLAFVLFSPLGLDPYQSIVLLYCCIGGLTAALIMVAAKEIMQQHKEWIVPTFFFTICQFGILQEMIGDVEVYAPFMFGLVAYVIVCLKSLRKNLHPIIPSLMFGVLFCIYSASIFLLPSLLVVIYILLNRGKRTGGFFQRLEEAISILFCIYLVSIFPLPSMLIILLIVIYILVSRRKRILVFSQRFKETIKLLIFCIGIGIGLPYALLYGGVMKNPFYIASGGYGGLAGFVALGDIFSFKHLMVVSSMQFLLQPSVWGVMLTVWLVFFALVLTKKLRFKQILDDLIFDSRSIFLLFAFMGFFFYSIVWNVYGTSLIWPNEFLTSWHTFSGLVVPGALLAAFWLVKGLPLYKFKKHIVFSVWILVSLTHTLPLVWWNHAHESVDFASFINPKESSIMLEKDLKLIAEIDVGNPKSEKRFNYHIGKTECADQVRFPPGGRFVFDYYVLNNVCRDGLLLPIASMLPSYAGIVDNGRLSLKGESFELNLESGKDLFIITRMHTGLGQQKIQISVDDQVLSEIDPQGRYIYKRYHYNNPVFVNWPILFEWEHWRESIFSLPGEKVAGGLACVSVLNMAQDIGYGSYHYFVYQEEGRIQTKYLVKHRDEKRHLFNLKLFKDRIMGGTLKRVERDEVPVDLCKIDPGYNTIFYQYGGFGGSFSISLSVKESWVDRICFLASSQYQKVFIPSFVVSLIFGDDTDSGEKFHLLFNELVHKRKKSGEVKDVYIVACTTDDEEVPQLFEVMSASHPSVSIQ